MSKKPNYLKDLDWKNHFFLKRKKNRFFLPINDVGSELANKIDGENHLPGEKINLDPIGYFSTSVSYRNSTQNVQIKPVETIY